MGSVPVVLVSPEIEFGCALGRVLIEAGVSPLAESTLDKALGLAVGAWGIGLGPEMTAGAGEPARVVAGGIVGEHAADGDAEAAVVSDGGVEEGDGGFGALVDEHLSKADAGVVVDGDVQDLPSGAAGFVAGIAGEAVARFGDAGQ